VKTKNHLVLPDLFLQEDLRQKKEKILAQGPEVGLALETDGAHTQGLEVGLALETEIETEGARTPGLALPQSHEILDTKMLLLARFWEFLV